MGMKREAGLRRRNSQARVDYAHTTIHNLSSGRQGVSRPPGGSEPHMIKHPTDLQPPLAVSHAVLVTRSHTGETF